MSRIDKELFSGQHEATESHGNCPDCGEKLQLRHSKNGAFLGCSAYPTCQFSKPLVEHETHDLKILEGTSCPECGSELALKNGRYGMFVGCSNYPDCHHIEHEESKVECDSVSCPSCQKGALKAKTSRYGKTFYSCDTYPKCKFVVNHQPVAGECEKCGYALLVKRQMAAGEKVQCALKKCGHFQAVEN